MSSVSNIISILMIIAGVLTIIACGVLMGLFWLSR